MSEMEWQPTETAPEGDLVLWFCPKAHRGLPSCEVLMRFNDPLYGESFWTNGGPNAGDDVDFAEDERPTHWMPLPPPPSAPGAGGK